MNIFLLNSDALKSGQEFVKIDPVRARKQLLECCQILASVEYALFGITSLYRKDGFPYGNAHPYHPIVKNCSVSPRNFWMCVEVAYGLARQFPDHACSKSFLNAASWGSVVNKIPNNIIDYVVCRSGKEVKYVRTRSEYVSILRPYLLAKTALSAEKGNK